MSEPSEIQWSFLSFDRLSNQQLYDVLQLRAEVFVVEQDCVYQDMDGYDQKATHVLGMRSGELVAYARIFAPGDKHTTHASIGRIVTHPMHRGQSLGKALVQRSIAYCKEHYGKASIHISAQVYLDRFYKELGFRTISDIYLEDGIDHQEMLLEI